MEVGYNLAVVSLPLVSKFWVAEVLSFGGLGYLA